MTLANKTIGNALAGVVGYAWPVALALVTTPYIVHKLGNDAYGVLALVTSVLGFFAFLDLGVTNASVKYIAEAYARNNTEEISKIIGSSLSVFLTVGAIGGLLISLMTSTLVQKFLKIPPEYISDSMFAFYIASCGFVLNMVVGVFASIPKAIQRYDLSTKVNLLVGTSLMLSVVLIVYLGYGLRQVVILNFISSLASLSTYILITRKYLKGVSIKIHFDPVTFKKLFQFGMYSLLAMVSSIIVLQLDRLLIGSYLGAASVAFYVVPATIAIGIHNIIVNLMSVVFPLCSHLYATREHDKLRELYLKANKYAFIIAISLAIPIVIFSTQIMHYWMGTEFGLKSHAVLAILTISAVFISMTTIPYFLLDGIGMPGVNAKFAILSAMINIFFCFLLIPRFGLIGAALANLSSFISIALYLITVDRIIMHIGIKSIARDIWMKPLAMGVIQAITLYYLLTPLVRGKVSLILVLIASLAIYYLVSFIFKVFNAEDKFAFGQYLSFKLKEDA